MKKDPIPYDYAIIGAGAAGLQLVMGMIKDSYFREKRILLIDKEEKRENDKTWCYWEESEGQWDELIAHQWQRGHFYGPSGEEVALDLPPYAYKMLPSDHFYTHAHEVLGGSSQVHWIKEEVVDVMVSNDGVQIIGAHNQYTAKHCFDSRIDPNFTKTDDGFIRILQHFKGWRVNFESDVFDEESFTMMDFRMLHDGLTSFTYVLPTSPREALIEYTLFTKDLLFDQQYDDYLKKYIEEYIGTGAFEVNDVEKGVIPMTNYPFHNASTDRITKIGTAGSWVRPSTGYSFKYCERYVAKIIENIKKGKRPDHHILSDKTRFLDTILLDILDKRNNLIPGIFHQIYAKNSVQDVLRFLDGTSDFYGDLKIINSPQAKPFLYGLYNQYVKGRD